MKRERLQAIRIGDEELPKEVIDLIMEENGRDIEREKAKYQDYDSIKEQLAAANEQIEKFKGMDIDGVRKAADEWKAKAEQAEKDYAEKIASMQFDGKVKDAIASAKGRNAKAIGALLDRDTLRASKNQDADIAAAIEQIKKENDYLFEAQTPPPYAPGAGTQTMTQDPLAASIRSAMGLKGE